MKYKVILFFVFFLWLDEVKAVCFSDSVAMRVNGMSLSCEEVEFRYQKSLINGVKSLSQYLDDLINLKLQVEVAKNRGLDTVRSFRDEMHEFRLSQSAFYLLGEGETPSSTHETDKNREGTICVRHIFKYLPQNALQSVLQETKAQMHSLYLILSQTPTDSLFDICVQRYSDEKDLFWVNYLEMPSEFEDVVWNMQVGEISHPFFTPQGLHIVQVKERKQASLPEFAKKTNTYQHKLQQRKKVENLVNKLKQEYHFDINLSGINELKARGVTSKVLFTLEKEPYSGLDFSRFASAFSASLPEQIDAFIIKSVLDYADTHLEQRYPEMRWSMEDHRDSVLCRMIQADLFSDAALCSDSIGLENFYKERRSDYYWDKPRYKGAVLQCVSKRIARRTRRFLKSIPMEEWGEAVNLVVNTGKENRVKITTGFFALGDNPYVDKFIFKEKKVEAEKDELFPVAVVLGEELKGPETIKEVGNILIEDYRTYLKRQWLDKLRASAKVEINQEVIKTVNKH